MTTNLTLEKSVITAIKRHLMSTDLLPPSIDFTYLATGLTEVVFDQFQEAGVDLAAWNKSMALKTKTGAPGMS